VSYKIIIEATGDEEGAKRAAAGCALVLTAQGHVVESAVVRIGNATAHTDVDVSPGRYELPPSPAAPPPAPDKPAADKPHDKHDKHETWR
jgi:hypothetical protein